MTDSATTAAPELLDRMSTALRHARERRVAIPALTDEFPGLSIPDAYAIAQRTVAADLAAGARVVGHKIGLTSLTVQQQLGVDEPDYGALLDTMQVADGAVLNAADYLAPRIELELAFRLGDRLSGPGVTAADVREATSAVHLAIELVDSRIADWKITLPDTVADSASAAGFVISDASFPLDQLDVTAVEVELYRGDERLEQGRSDAVLGDPCEAVAWLANAVGQLGETLDAGEIVLSGACTRMAPAEAGASYRGVFAGLGELNLSFTGGN